MSLQVIKGLQTVSKLRTVLCSGVQQANFSTSFGTNEESLYLKLRAEYPTYKEIKTSRVAFVKDTSDQDGKPLYEVNAFALDATISKNIYAKHFINWQKAMLDIAKQA
eukprot:TRINITY_DN3143_c0_g1_i1.p3 TRINITY_DN3143_c0_g1~~TRINITY_DN3143_c0_g1_i1.p3  ORF type:complete len:118 (-),score=10.46 TRINITY_DN3143_c0_g1_i1:252-575(-)